MAGALIQLVAQGVQDLYLTTDPQITFFKIIYRRHTNFSVESIIQKFVSIGNFGETVTCEISKLGDLMEKIFIYVEISSIPKFINQDGEENNIKKIAWVNNLGYALIQYVSIEIGGKMIDKQYGEWMYIYSQINNKQKVALNKMIGNVPSMYEFSNGKNYYKLYIPLEFWFCKYSGLALPLVALTSSDIKLIISFRRLEECIRIGPTHSIEIMENVVPFKSGDYIEQTINNQTIYGYVIDFDYIEKKLYYIKIHSPTATKRTFESNENSEINMKKYRIYDSITREFSIPKSGSKENVENTLLEHKPQITNSFLYVNYVYLDKEERIRFMNSSHEYLIEQVQFNQEIGIKSPNVKQNLILNHPCKVHCWIVQLDRMVGPNTMNDIFNFTSSHINNINYQENLVKNATLLLNDRERFTVRTGEYFNLVQPYQHYLSGPDIGINIYSFSLNPDEFQPSSTCNMSNFTNISMNMSLLNIINQQNTCKIRSYTINYNILRIYLNVGTILFKTA